MYQVLRSPSGEFRRVNHQNEQSVLTLSNVPDIRASLPLPHPTLGASLTRCKKGFLSSLLGLTPQEGKNFWESLPKASKTFKIALEQDVIIGPEENRLFSFSVGVRE